MLCSTYNSMVLNARRSSNSVWQHIEKLCVTRDVPSSPKAQTHVFQLLMCFLRTVRMLQGHDSEWNDTILFQHFFRRSEMSHCGVAAHGASVLAWRLLPARCRQCLETLRPVTGAKFQVIHLDIPMSVWCGDCLVRVVGSGLREV